MMIYETFEDLSAAYPERSEQNFEEELSYVEDLFDTYEQFGFLESFSSPFEDERKYEGMSFTVLRRLSYVLDDVDLECLPMWLIRLEDGTEMQAYPEEICQAEKKATQTTLPKYHTTDELRKDDTLKFGGRDDHQKVIVDGTVLYAVPTMQQIEDLICGKAEELYEELAKRYGISYDEDEIATVRDGIVKALEENGFRIVPMCESY